MEQVSTLVSAVSVGPISFADYIFMPILTSLIINGDCKLNLRRVLSVIISCKDKWVLYVSVGTPRRINDFSAGSLNSLWRCSRTIWRLAVELVVCSALCPVSPSTVNYQIASPLPTHTQTFSPTFAAPSVAIAATVYSSRVVETDERGRLVLQS